MSFDEGPPAVQSDRPADDRADGLAGDTRGRDGDVAPEVRVDPVAEQDYVLAGQGARGENARVEPMKLVRELETEASSTRGSLAGYRRALFTRKRRSSSVGPNEFAAWTLATYDPVDARRPLP